MASTFNLNLARGLMLGDGFRKIIAGITGPASYATAGETLTAGAFKLGVIEWFPPVMLHSADMSSAVIGLFNHTTLKLCYYWPGAGGGAAGGVDFAYTPADLKGATTVVAGSVTADQAAAPVNTAFYQAATANSVLAGTLVLTGAPDIGRGVMITIGNTSGGALDILAAGGTVAFTVTGKFRGAAQVEVINFTVTAGQSSVANNKYRFNQGVLPFDTITSITYTGTATMGAALTVAAGPGSLIGLPQNRLTPADADVLTFSVSGIAKAVAGAFSDANKTVEVGTTADAWDLALVYKVAGATSNYLTEVANTTDLSGYAGRSLVHGR